MSTTMSEVRQRALPRLLDPRRIAVIGGREAEEVIAQCDKLGFDGVIEAVNPRRDTMGGRKCIGSVADLEEIPDAVFIAVPAEATIEAVAQLAAMGAGGAVCYASGFREVGEAGAARQQRLVEAAGAMPIIGPNCHGALNYLTGAMLWPDQHGGERVAGGVAIISQSGNMAINMTMQQRALPLAVVLALGNQAAVGIEDCMEALLEDDRISAIGLHIEGLRDPARFAAAAARARQKRVPVVALKTGRTATAARINMGHTASLAGSDRLYETLFRRLGVARADSVDGFFETLKLLSVSGPLVGPRIVSLSCSGGEAALVADLAEGRGVEFPDFGEAHAADVRATLNEYVSVSNPLDYHTFIWNDADKLEACFRAVMGGAFDLAMLVMDFPRDDRCSNETWWPTAEAFVKARADWGGHGAIVATMPECLPEAIGKRLREKGVAPMLGVRQALDSFEEAWRVGRTWGGSGSAPRFLPGAAPGEAETWDERRAKNALTEHGISVPAGGVVETIDDAVAVAARFEGAVALKAVSPDIVHKTEAGAVRLGLSGEAAVREAASDLLEISPRILVEEMVTDSVAELILGVDRDEQFGPYLLIGFGGVTVEMIADTAVLLFPVEEKDVRNALAGLKTAALLEGYRGRPRGDVDAAVAAVMSLARFVEENASSLLEVDINPLMVRPEGMGAVAADAYIKVTKET